MPRLTPNFMAWVLIITIAIAARVAGGVWWQSRLPPEKKFFFGDSESYWVLGQTIAAGEEYQFKSPDARVFRTPGYPLLLAGLFRVFGHDAPVIAARVLSAVLGGITVGLVGWWTTRLFDARAGLYAGVIAAFYPGAVAMGAFVLSEAPFCPLMIGELGLWGLAWRAPTNRRAAVLALGSGAAAALATLMRPSWLLFMPFALLVAVVLGKDRRRQGLIGLAMYASFVVCMLPWWIRNVQVTGHFIATSLQVGASLYDGLNPDADGASNLDFVPSFAAQEHHADGTDAAKEPFEYRLNRRLTMAAIDWARVNPGRAAQLAWVKFVRIWNVWPNEPSFRSWPVRLALLFTYTPLLVLGMVGGWRFTRCGWPYVLAWLPAIYLTLLHVVFVGSIRYREPAMLALTVLASGVLSSGKRRPSLGDYPAARATCIG